MGEWRRYVAQFFPLKQAKLPAPLVQTDLFQPFPLDKLPCGFRTAPFTFFWVIMMRFLQHVLWQHFKHERWRERISLRAAPPWNPDIAGWFVSASLILGVTPMCLSGWVSHHRAPSCWNKTQSGNKAFVKYFFTKCNKYIFNKAVNTYSYLVLCFLRKE